MNVLLRTSRGCPRLSSWPKNSDTISWQSAIHVFCSQHHWSAPCVNPDMLLWGCAVMCGRHKQRFIGFWCVFVSMCPSSLIWMCKSRKLTLRAGISHSQVSHQPSSPKLFMVLVNSEKSCKAVNSPKASSTNHRQSANPCTWMPVPFVGGMSSVSSWWEQHVAAAMHATDAPIAVPFAWCQNVSPKAKTLSVITILRPSSMASIGQFGGRSSLCLMQPIFHHLQAVVSVNV